MKNLLPNVTLHLALLIGIMNVVSVATAQTENPDEGGTRQSIPDSRFYVPEYSAGLIVHGLYPGMAAREFTSQLNQVVEGNIKYLKQDIPPDFVFPIGHSPQIINQFEVNGVNYGAVYVYENVVIGFMLTEEGVNHLFKVADLTGRDFAKLFMSSYGIPELNVKYRTDYFTNKRIPSYWEYSSVQKGYHLRIFVSKAFSVVLVPKMAERNFR